MANLGMPDDIGEPIATRQLEAPAGVVLVEFGKPQPWQHNQWICGYRITGLRDDPEVLWLPGHDSVSALLAVVAFAGDVCAKANPPLKYLNSSNLCLPVTDADGNRVIRAVTEADEIEALGPDAAADMKDMFDRVRQEWAAKQRPPE